MDGKRKDKTLMDGRSRRLVIKAKSILK